MSDSPSVRDRTLIDANVEIEAMAEINELLQPFDNKTRRRMLEWVVAFQAELPVAVIPSVSRGED